MLGIISKTYKMNIKEHVEGHAVLYVLGMLITGFLSGIGASTWIQEGREKIINEKISFQEAQINLWKSEAEKNTVDCFEKYQRKIHVMNTENRGNEIVTKIKRYLSEVQNFHPEGIFVMLESLETVEDEAKKKPHLLVVHRHAFQKNKDDLLIEAIKIYYAKNDKIKFLVFSESFLNESGKEEFNRNLGKLKERVKLIGVDYRKLPDDSGLQIRNQILSMLKE